MAMCAYQKAAQHEIAQELERYLAAKHAQLNKLQESGAAWKRRAGESSASVEETILALESLMVLCRWKERAEHKLAAAEILQQRLCAGADAGEKAGEGEEAAA